jgi:hypothetical protein
MIGIEAILKLIAKIHIDLATRRKFAFPSLQNSRVYPKKCTLEPGLSNIIEKKAADKKSISGV